MPLPVAAAAKAASVAAPVAKRAAQSDWTPVVVGVGLLLLLRGIGNIQDLFNKPAELAGALAAGTGDFFQGAFSGAARTEAPITTARIAEQPDTTFQLTPGVVLGDFSTWDRNLDTRYIAEYDEDGQPIVTIENPSPILAPPLFTTIGPEPSLAQRVGAAVVFDPITGLYTDPLLDIGDTVIIPSVESFIDTPIIGFRGEGFGPSLGDVGSFFKGLF